MQLMLETCPATLEYLAQRQIRYCTAETNEAVRIYNELAQQGALIDGGLGPR
jgi:hypothetical protein